MCEGVPVNPQCEFYHSIDRSDLKSVSLGARRWARIKSDQNKSRRDQYSLQHPLPVHGCVSFYVFFFPSLPPKPGHNCQEPHKCCNLCTQAANQDICPNLCFIAFPVARTGDGSTRCLDKERKDIECHKGPSNEAGGDAKYAVAGRVQHCADEASDEEIVPGSHKHWGNDDQRCRDGIRRLEHVR